MASSFMNMVTDLFGMFNIKRVQKSDDVMIENSDPMSRNKYLKENLDEELENVKVNKSKIKDQNSGKLLAILENLEAIELNLKMAQKYENSVNSLCSVYFPEIDEILSDESNMNLSPLEFISKYIPNFNHPNFKQGSTPGVFITQYLSRQNRQDEDERIVNFVVENLDEVVNKNEELHLLSNGVESKVYKLPDDTNDEEVPKKVIKKMNFKDMYYEDLKNRFLNDEPILDMILLMIKTKRQFFEEVYKEIEINAVMNHFHLIDSVYIDQRADQSNEEVVTFYGCLNIRWKKNYKRESSLKVIETIRNAYMSFVDDPTNIRDLNFEDLERIVDENSLDVSKAGEESSVDELSVEYKINVLYKFFWDTNLYEDYEYIFITERMDMDLFDDVFQKVYFLMASSLGERLKLYTTLTKHIEKLHLIGYSHCDIKVANLLYKINAENNLFNINYTNFRLIDFDNAQSLKQFCKGGAQGYLAPEIYNKLEVPFHSLDFLKMLLELSDVQQDKYSKISFENYLEFVKTLKQDEFGIIIPEDYVDFRLTIANGSFNVPSTFQNWIDLLTQLTPIFDWMNIVPKINYQPQMEDAQKASEQLMIITKLKTQKATDTPKTDQTMERTKYHLRNLRRKALEEGTLNYEPEKIQNLNKADSFSLGLLFTEIETALNSTSIFETFKSKLDMDNSEESYMNNLINPIKTTFEMKTNLNKMPTSLEERCLPFFKSSVDMRISANHYSNEFKQAKSNVQNRTKLQGIISQLEGLIISMLSYYAYDRPDITQIRKTLEEITESYMELRNDKRYLRLMNALEFNIRNGSAELFKIKYKQIYKNTDRRLMI
jgi:serine/threonine protein kinase